MSYTGRFRFPVSPLELWAAMARVDQFERWWNWLTDLRLEGGPLQTGSVLRGTVAPPVPYRMRVAVELERCLPGQLIDANVSGDLDGTASLCLQPEESDPRGTVASVAWSLEMKQLPMRVAARFAYPLLKWGHDCVVEATVAGFRSQLAPSERLSST